MPRLVRFAGRAAAGALVVTLAGGVASAQPGPPATLPAVRSPAPVVPPTAPGLFAQTPPGTGGGPAESGDGGAGIPPGSLGPTGGGEPSSQTSTGGQQAASGGETGTGSGAGRFDWKKVPVVRPFPRPGFFQIPPTGPGYYSAYDALTGNEFQGPPKRPYPRGGPLVPRFFDIDNFSYLEDPANTETDYLDFLKRVYLGDDWLFVNGGEVRDRYENRHNSFLARANDDYQLGRIRTYGDLWYKDVFRVYAEFIGAGEAGERLAPIARGINRADFQNLFIDVKLFDIADRPVYTRVGRQELLFGSQRLVSPAEWNNSPLTFQGVRTFRQSDKLDVDAFWVQPVIINTTKLDSVDDRQNFWGTFATYRPKPGQAIDAYYLGLENGNRAPAAANNLSAPFTRHTFGGRVVGDVDGSLLYETEAALQLGENNGRNVIAGFATTGLGYRWKDAPWNPTVWLYYDYASGGKGTGTDHTFNQLFPFGHYYLGWIDQVGRQNIHDFNVHFYFYPTKWATGWVQFHRFWLADPRDALYLPSGAISRQDKTGNSGTDVGREVDFVAQFHVSSHIDLMTGYCKFFGGDFIKATSTATAAVNADFTFVQLSYRW